MHLEDWMKEDWMKKTEIRLAKREEVTTIKELIVLAYTPIEPILGRKPRGMLETEEKVIERIDKKTVYSVLFEDKLMGTFTIKHNERYDLMEVQKIAIEPDMQNKGFGSYIMESTEHLVRGMDQRKIMIQTYEDHKQLVDFYLHRVYKTFDTRDRKGNVVLMMEKKLWRED